MVIVICEENKQLKNKKNYYFNKEFEFGKNGFKTHVLHHLIRNCHINFLRKTQYILLHIITSQ